MFGDTQQKNRKKELSEFTNLLAIPLVLSMVNSAFFRVAAAAFSSNPDAGGTMVNFSLGTRHTGINIGVPFSVMILLAYIWARPAFMYVRQPHEELKKKIRLRIENVYRDAFLMVVIAQALALALPGFAGMLSWKEYAAAAVAFVAQAALLVVHIDSHLSQQKRLIENLYTSEELSRLRPGFSIPLYMKFSALVIVFAMIPFALIYLLFVNRVPWNAVASDLGMLLFLSGVLLFTGLSTLYRGVQVPLNGLIAKMNQVANGNFAKTRIYFSDEVAYLKDGYNRMVDGLKEREELRDTFGKYLSIEIARELIHNKKVNLGGEDIEAAVMFCDIRNFTPLSERMSAATLVAFLNDYFHYITPPITAHHGVINKFIGDAVMAVFTPMLGSSDYAGDAIRAAVGMRRALSGYNDSGTAPGKVDFGIGIHAGRLVAGNIGTAARLEYTFIGDTVNIASRLESKSKDLDTDIIVSGSVIELARPAPAGVRFEPLGKAALKGKTAQVEIYKLTAL